MLFGIPDIVPDGIIYGEASQKCMLSTSKMACAVCLVAQLCPTLCDPRDCSPPGSLSIGILQARTLEWVATPSSRGSSQPRDRTQVSHIAGGFFSIGATREAHKMAYPYLSPVNSGLAKKLIQVFLSQLMEISERTFWATQRFLSNLQSLCSEVRNSDEVEKCPQLNRHKFSL